MFCDHFLKTLDRHAPSFKKLSKMELSHKCKPWITKSIHKSVIQNIHYHQRQFLPHSI